MNNSVEHESWQAAAEAVLEPDIASYCATQVPKSFELEAEEVTAVERMSPRRIAEFRLGRYCAREALKLLGHGAQAVPVGTHREPMWPPDCVGTIAHACGRAAAAVAPADRYAGLGLDIERLVALPSAQIALIASQAELSADWPMEEPLRATLLFSAKESLYKAIWPRIRRYVDFMDVELRPGALPGEYVANPLRGFTREERALVAGLRGRLGRYRGLIVTSATIDADHSTGRSA